MKNIFTQNMLFGITFLLSGVFANAQTGLQNVIVERYYLSDANDAAASIGVLPAHSVTYRVFLDMKQGYRFQTAYGSPDHTLFINTSTSFFNNEDRGAVTPTYTKSQAKNNTVMLDSWLSAGAACVGNFGIPKSEDDGVATVINADGILQNNDLMAGIPLTVQDGQVAGVPGTFMSIGVDNEITVFDATSQAGNSFLTNNGAWFCLAGAIGPDTTNKVLIAQITTDGVMSFELNIQIGTPEGGTEQYVAKNPINLETHMQSLTFNSSVNTGIEQQPVKPTSDNDLVSVYPNPTAGPFSINVKTENTSSDKQYTIYDLLGNIVLKKKFEDASGNSTEKIDLSGYPNGMYFVEISLDGIKSTRKIMKN